MFINKYIKMCEHASVWKKLPLSLSALLIYTFITTRGT